MMSEGNGRSSGGRERPNTRLEVDDPEHCKKCGGELPKSDYKDSQGRPMFWAKLNWQSIELCPDCWAEKEIDKLRSLWMERYGGECAEVLWDV